MLVLLVLLFLLKNLGFFSKPTKKFCIVIKFWHDANWCLENMKLGKEDDKSLALKKNRIK